jgi:hypothetical protein
MAKARSAARVGSASLECRPPDPGPRPPAGSERSRYEVSKRVASRPEAAAGGAWGVVGAAHQDAMLSTHDPPGQHRRGGAPSPALVQQLGRQSLPGLGLAGSRLPAGAEVGIGQPSDSQTTSDPRPSKPSRNATPSTAPRSSPAGGSPPAETDAARRESRDQAGSGVDVPALQSPSAQECLGSGSRSRARRVTSPPGISPRVAVTTTRSGGRSPPSSPKRAATHSRPGSSGEAAAITRAPGPSRSRYSGSRSRQRSSTAASRKGPEG